MKKRILACVLSALMLLPMLAACTGTQGVATEAPTKEAEQAITEPPTQTATETPTEPESEAPTVSSADYQAGNDIVVTPIANPEQPVGKITLFGQDITQFTVITSYEERGAGAKIRDYIGKAVGTQPGFIIESDTDAPEHTYEIVVGTTSRDIDAVTSRRATLGDEGYMIYAQGNRLYISGATTRGTYYGAFNFLQDYLGVRFYTNDCERILPAEEITIPTDLDFSYIPVFSYRVADFDFNHNADYSAYHMLNGYVAGNLDGYGGGISYAGGAYVHTFIRLAEMENYQVGDQPCLTDPDVYATVLKNVKEWLRGYGNARIISVSQNDSYSGQGGCECDACKASDEKYGSPAGTLLAFVNKLAGDIKDEYPNVMVETLAYHYTRTPPTGIEAADNVLIRLCPSEVCQVHGLSDHSCETNTQFIADIEAWSKICKHLSIWDYIVDFANYLTIFPNLYAMRENVMFYASHNVVNVYGEGNYNSKSGDFEELRAYLYAKLLWNPNMSEEEYQYWMDDFLQGYYGDGWEYIKRYIELLTEKSAATTHFNHGSVPLDILPYSSKRASDALFVNDMVGLFEKALAVTTDETQRARLLKAEIQIIYYRQYAFKSKDAALNEALYRQIENAKIYYFNEGRLLPKEPNFKGYVRTW